MIIDNFFEEDVMSVHFKEDTPIRRKRWKPWNWYLEEINEITSKEYLMNIINNLYKEASWKKDSFIEIDRKFSKVLQIKDYRIVIVLPPVSDWIEITIVRPIKKTSIFDYNLSDTVINIFDSYQRWIFICWSPWEWKTTFAHALIEYLSSKNKIIKTVEAPRDLNVSEIITQYSFSYTTHSEIRDILLLSRPDYVVYDEVRNAEDFLLFKDLRLAGIWLIWVVHATRAIDSIQRLLSHVDIWILPQVIDTVIFIKSWKVESILTLKTTVKVPSWMMSVDLARPVIEVYDFFTNSLEYEIYTFWEEVIVMPIWEISIQENKMTNYALRYIYNILRTFINFDFVLRYWWEDNILIYVPKNLKWQIIWKNWENISKIEENLWLKISVKTIDEIKPINIEYELINYGKSKKNIVELFFWDKYKDSFVCAKWREIYFFTLSREWSVKFKNWKIIEDILSWNFKILSIF